LVLLSIKRKKYKIPPPVAGFFFKQAEKIIKEISEKMPRLLGSIKICCTFISVFHRILDFKNGAGFLSGPLFLFIPLPIFVSSYIKFYSRNFKRKNRRFEAKSKEKSQNQKVGLTLNAKGKTDVLQSTSYVISNVVRNGRRRIYKRNKRRFS